MACYIQIGDDPTHWWVAEQIQASQLTGGQPLSVICLAPIEGLLVVSPRSASVAIFDAPAGTPPPPLGIAGTIVYVPTATGPSAGHVGYQLSGNADPANVANQVTTAMRQGHTQAITLASGGGTLVLNGATLSFAVFAPVGIGGSTPHG